MLLAWTKIPACRNSYSTPPPAVKVTSLPSHTVPAPIPGSKVAVGKLLTVTVWLIVLVSTSQPFESINPIVILSPSESGSMSEGSVENVIVVSEPCFAKAPFT